MVLVHPLGSTTLLLRYKAAQRVVPYERVSYALSPFSRARILMGSIFKKYLQALIANTGASKLIIKAAPPFVEIVFDKSEIVSMLRGVEKLSQALNYCFCERRVFWTDLTAESYEYVMISLDNVQSELRNYDNELIGSSDAGSMGLAKFVRAWASQTALTQKELSDKIDRINKEKAEDPFYDTAGSDRHDALVESLIDLRRRVYPSVRALSEFLNDEDPTKHSVKEKLAVGLKILNPTEIIGLEPQLEELV